MNSVHSTVAQFPAYGGSWMKRAAGLLLALSTLIPAGAQAQKPSNSSETRSADVYLGNAQRSNLDSEKKDWLEQALTITATGLQKDPSNPKLWMQRGQAYQALITISQKTALEPVS